MRGLLDLPRIASSFDLYPRASARMRVERLEPLGRNHAQYPVRQIRGYLVPVHGVRKAENPVERAARTLDPVVVPLAEAGLLPALSLYGQDVVLDLDGYPVDVHAGKLGLEHYALFGLVDVHRRKPHAAGPEGAAHPEHRLVEETAHPFVQQEEVFERVFLYRQISLSSPALPGEPAAIRPFQGSSAGAWSESSHAASRIPGARAA